MTHIRTVAGLAAALLVAQGALAQLDHPAADPASPAERAPKPIRITPATPTTPVVPEALPHKKPIREPIYDESADAREQMAAALAKAKRDHSRVLLQWGANWCGWCHMLHHTFGTNADLKKEINYEYIPVLIDVGGGGRPAKYKDLAKELDADIHGYPFITILDQNGKPVANTDTDDFEIKGPDGKSVTGDGAGHDPAKLMAFLKVHEAPRVEAAAALKEGIARAQSSGKLVFLHFGAPWCGWCHRLDDWMAQPQVASILGKNFVDVKVDLDRMPGAKELSQSYKAVGGPPWFAFVDPDSGKALATTTNAKGENIGFPSEPDEIEHFVGMLKAAAKKLSPAEISTLEASLKPKTDKPT